VNYEILIIYDNDNDTTLPIIRQNLSDYENLYLVKNNVFPGPSGALRTGFFKANAPVILVTMADLSDEIVGIDKLIVKIPNKFGIISFSRFCRGGKINLNRPNQFYSRKRIKHSLKVLFPRIAGKVIKFFTGIGTNDPTNSYKLYSAAMLKRLDLKSTVSFSVTLEIVMKSYALGYETKEIPTTWSDRNFGESNFPLIKSLISYFPWLKIIILKNRLYSLNRNWFIETYSNSLS